MEKMKGKKDKKGKHAEEESTSRRTGSSAQVFKNLQKIVQQDYKKKEEKRQAKQTGKAAFMSTTEGSGLSTKRYKL